MLGLAPAPSDLRTDPRTHETHDLFAAVRPPGRDGAFVAVHDLSAHGMGIDHAPPLHPGEQVRLEFWGSDFAWSGTARVAHADEDCAGLQFLSWDGPVHRPLNRLLSSRSS